MKNLFMFLLGVIAFASILRIRDNKSISDKAVITHYLVCNGMTDAIAVYGTPQSDGVYLSVKLKPNAKAKLIGPGCAIMPNPEEIE